MKHTVIQATNRTEAITIAQDIRAELDLPAVPRYRSGLGWHVTVTRWA